MSAPQPPPDRPARPGWVSWDQVTAERRQRDAALMGSGAPSVLTPATLFGPNPVQEGQAAAQTERGATSPAAAATSVGQAVTQPIESQVMSTAEDLRKNPRHTLGVVGGAIVGGSVLGKIAPAARLLRLSSGAIVRAGSPIMQAGAAIFDQALGSAAGAALGGEQGRPIGETTPDALRRRLTDAATGAVGTLMEPVGVAAVRSVRAVPGTLSRMLPTAQGSGVQRARDYFMERLLGTGVPKGILPGSVAAQEAMREHGETLTMGQLANTPWYQSTEAILETAYGSRNAYSSTHEGATQAAIEGFHKAAPQFGRNLTEAQLGNMTTEVLSGSNKMKQAVVDANYNFARKVAQDAGVADNVVDIGPVVKYLFDDTALQVRQRNPLAKEINDTIMDLVDPGAVPILKSTKGTAYAPVSFEQAEALRSALQDLAYRKGVEDDTKRLALPYAKMLDEAMDTAAASLGVPEVRSAYLAARAVTKGRNEPFNDAALGALIEQRRPEQIAQALVKSGTPSTVNALWRVVDSPSYQDAVIRAVQPYGGTSVQDYKDAVINAYLNEAVLRAGERTSTVPGPGGIPDQIQQLNGKTLSNFITGSRGQFEAVVQDPTARKNLETFATAVKLSQTRAKGRTMTFLYQILQNAAVYGSTRLLTTGFQDATGAYSAGFLALPAGIASFTRAGPVVSWMLNRAITAPARSSVLTGRALAQWSTKQVADLTAQYIDKLRQSGVPFIYTAPNGQTTTFDPRSGVQGPMNPTPSSNPHKPQSKTGPGGTQ